LTVDGRVLGGACRAIGSRHRSGVDLGANWVTRCRKAGSLGEAVVAVDTPIADDGLVFKCTGNGGIREWTGILATSRIGGLGETVVVVPAIIVASLRCIVRGACNTIRHKRTRLSKEKSADDNTTTFWQTGGGYPCGSSLTLVGVEASAAKDRIEFKCATSVSIGVGRAVADTVNFCLASSHGSTEIIVETPTSSTTRNRGPLGGTGNVGIGHGTGTLTAGSASSFSETSVVILTTTITSDWIEIKSASDGARDGGAAGRRRDERGDGGTVGGGIKAGRFGKAIVVEFTTLTVDWCVVCSTGCTLGDLWTDGRASVGILSSSTGKAAVGVEASIGTNDGRILQGASNSVIRNGTGTTASSSTGSFCETSVVVGTIIVACDG